MRLDGVITPTTPVDIERTTAWMQRRLMFDDDTLAAVVQEFNRYNHSQFVIDDPVLRERRISGIFNANDPEAFLAFLSSMVAIRVIAGPDARREIVGPTTTRE